jgi:hypothetical protein
MNRLLASALLLSLPGFAHAGIGFTHYQGGDQSAKGYAPSGSVGLPTVDYRSGDVLIQVHALELIAGVAAGDDSIYGTSVVNFGTNVHVQTGKRKINEWCDGVSQPGASVDFFKGLGDADDGTYDGSSFAGNFVWRAGAQSTGKMGVGIYVAPSIGFGSFDAGTDDNEMDITVGGTLQVSIWSK